MRSGRLDVKFENNTVNDLNAPNAEIRTNQMENEPLTQEMPKSGSFSDSESIFGSIRDP